MGSEISNKTSQQILLALQFSLIISAISIIIIFIINIFLFKHLEHGPLTAFQFYGILFVVVFGLVTALLIFTEEKEVVVEDVSEFTSKMTKKKLKKAKKAKSRAR